MVDIVSKEVRSRMMAGIRGKHTAPELTVRKFLHVNGFRFRLHVRTLPGVPDVVLSKYKLVIFVHGCFWHRHEGCRFATCPDDATGKWKKKFADTLLRDTSTTDRLLESKWRVFVLWECGISKKRGSNNVSWLPSAIRDPSIQYLEWPRIDKS